MEQQPQVTGQCQETVAINARRAEVARHVPLRETSVSPTSCELRIGGTACQAAVGINMSDGTIRVSGTCLNP